VIYIYKKFTTPGFFSGIGYIVEAFQRAFPDAEIITQPNAIAELDRDDVLIFPRIFIHTNNIIEPETYYLMHTKAKVVQSVFWDLEALPRCVALSIGRADLLHAPSKFVARLFQPHSNLVIFPIPPREYPKRTSPSKNKTIGAVLASVHGRKNIAGYTQLMQELPDWLLHLVLTPLWSEYPEQRAAVEKLINLPNVVVYTNLSEQGMIDFYHSLEWFVVLSGGEAYHLPTHEALKCGVPVIAPDNSVFSELRGAVSGLYLVETEISPTAPTQDTVGLPLRFPRIKSVVDIIKNTTPPKPDVVRADSSVLPSFSDWCAFWRAQVSELQQRKTLWNVREYPALFALHNRNFVLGLNDVSRRWARKVGGATFCAYDELPYGVRAPIIIPYAQGFSDWMQGAAAPPILVLVSLLRARNPEAPIILWVHNNIQPAQHSVLAPFVDLFCGTTVTMMLMNPLLRTYLPQPIGNPLAPDTKQGDYFLIWGVNYTVLVWYEIFLRYFRYPVYMQFAFSTEMPQGAYVYINSLQAKFGDSRRVHFDFGLPKDDDELEQLLDSAAGYICIDFYYPPITTGESSARIATVLRKGKPVIANDSARNLEWGAYLNIVRFSEKLLNADEQAVASFARYITENMEIFIPKNVPTVEQEIGRFREVIALAKDEHARRVRADAS